MKEKPPKSPPPAVKKWTMMRRLEVITKGLSASVIGAEFEKVAKKFGRGDATEVSPRELVDHAADLDCPIHSLFEWDDAKAGDAHRRYQARKIINSVTCVYIKNEPVRTFVPIKRQGEPSRFVAIPIVLSSDLDTRQMLRDAYAGVKSWRDRCSQLVECTKNADVKAAFKLFDIAIARLGEATEKTTPVGNPQRVTAAAR